MISFYCFQHQSLHFCIGLQAAVVCVCYVLGYFMLYGSQNRYMGMVASSKTPQL